ncbi:hypothetical protein BT93_L4859 [Corymbia citriodora subsp. variegata]|uniref:Uncharacterized protein n=1 Tax=Corymbia citriodora subsp. variegata TaxID=360336 RepID=A0A8T0CTY0_CORYI|nr:hypothetical protein BT93_L4859 [Corymbia citriodora subsp. variegata]
MAFTWCFPVPWRCHGGRCHLLASRLRFLLQQGQQVHQMIPSHFSSLVDGVFIPWLIFGRWWYAVFLADGLASFHCRWPWSSFRLLMSWQTLLYISV